MFRSDQNLPSPLFSITKDPEILEYNNGTEGENKNILNNPEDLDYSDMDNSDTTKEPT